MHSDTPIGNRFGWATIVALDLSSACPFCLGLITRSIPASLDVGYTSLDVLTIHRRWGVHRLMTIRLLPIMFFFAASRPRLMRLFFASVYGSGFYHSYTSAFLDPNTTAFSLPAFDFDHRLGETVFLSDPSVIHHFFCSPPGPWAAWALMRQPKPGSGGRGKSGASP